MRFKNLTPDRTKTRDTLVSRHLTWHTPVSRRTFLGWGWRVRDRGGTRRGALTACSRLGGSRDRHVLPIPSTLSPFAGVEIHVQAPPFTGVNTDPSTVWNFQGASGIAFMDTSVMRRQRKTGEKEVLPSTMNHMTFMQGIYVGRDGHVREGTFSLV